MPPLPLPPYSSSLVLDLAARQFGRRWRTLYGVAAVFLVPAYVVMDVAASTYAPRFNIWLGQLQRDIEHANPLPALPADAPLAVGVLLAALVIMLLASSAARAALIHAADATYRGHDASLRASATCALRRLPALAGGMLVYYAAGIAIALAGLVAGAPLVLEGGFLAFVGLVIIVGGLAGLVLLGVRVTLLEQAIMLERLGALAALRRSWRLSVGSGWRILGYTVVLAVLSAIVGAFVSGIPVLVLNLQPELSGDVVVSTVFDGLVDLLVAPLTPLVFTLLYYDMRGRAGEPPVPEPAFESVPEEQV